MSQAFYPTNDGHVGNLEKLSLIQLHDLIKRQEDLIRKRGFLVKLPDKGEKIKEHLEILQAELSKREAIRFGSPTVPEADHTKLNAECNIIHTDTGVDKSQANSDERVLESVLTGKGWEIKSDEEISTYETERNGSDDSKPEPMDLEVALDRLTLRDGESKERVQADVKHKHGYDFAVEKSEENVKSGLRQPLKLNRGLKVEHVKDLPPELLHLRDQMKVPPMPATHPPHVPVESAATPPDYKYSSAKIISLQESLDLMQKQRQKQEELNAQAAAVKLASRLGLKLDNYNPEGVDMSYRIKGAVDSDDDDDDDEIPATDDSEDRRTALQADSSDTEIPPEFDD